MTDNPTKPRQRVLRNAIAGFAQAAISGLVLFFLYRYLLGQLGAESLGLWSVVSALIGLARLADIGICGAAVRLAAAALAAGDPTAAGRLISATMLGTVVLLTPAVAAAAYVLLRYEPSSLVSHHQELTSLVPGMAVVIWLGFLSNPLRAGLDACQRVDLRQALIVFQQVTFLVGAWILVPGHGLDGIVKAQVLAAVTSLVAGIFLLWREFTSCGIPLAAFSWSCVPGLLRLGGRLQVVNVAMLFYDPITKNLLAQYGGLSATAWFEMASRLVFQVRALLISALETLVPYVASLQQEGAPTRISYLEVARLNTLLAALTFGLTATALPIISRLWVGHIQTTFILFAMLLMAGWWVNTLAAPAYFFLQGMGFQRWSMLAGWTMAMGNATFSWVLGRYYGAAGVVIGWALSLILSSFIISGGLHDRLDISLREVFPLRTAVFSMGMVVIGLITLWDPCGMPILSSIAGVVMAALLGLSNGEVRGVIGRIATRIRWKRS